jgi:AcrR family transcriptional regulator
MTTLKEDDKTRAYHHGDLRNTLIQLGTEMLIESGEASLSLRKLAQRAGVSHNAPYQHFADKNAMVAAIAEEGFRMLGEVVDRADDPNLVHPTERLAVVGRAYVAFALAHPSHLQLMFGTFPNSNYPSLTQQATQTLERLVGIVQELHAQGQLNAAPPSDAALVLWMTLHGLSAVLIADKIPDALRQGRSPEALAERFVQILCAGLVKL